MTTSTQSPTALADTDGADRPVEPAGVDRHGWVARLHAWWLTPHADRGQATAEYALVLLGAAMVALILVGWATGGGAGRIGSLLDRVIDAITGSF